MHPFYIKIETLFEKLTLIATSFLGNSVVFIIGLCLVLFWWTLDFFSNASMHDIIGDIIFGTTFLSLFIIQKANNKFSAVLHLKLNELIASHEPANNSVLHTDEKSEREIIELSKVYTELEEIIDEDLAQQEIVEDEMDKMNETILPKQE